MTYKELATFIIERMSEEQQYCDVTVLALDVEMGDEFYKVDAVEFLDENDCDFGDRLDPNHPYLTYSWVRGEYE